MDTLTRIEAAVVQAITAAILNGDSAVGEVSPAPRQRAPKATGKRRLSAAGRAAISRAAKRRWAAERAKKAKRSRPRARKRPSVAAPTVG